MSVAVCEPVSDLPFDFGDLVTHLSQAKIEIDPDHLPERCSGGLANLNYRISVEGRPAILRRAPSGPLPKGAHDMKREHRVLSRLTDAFSLAPRCYYLCEDPKVIGAPFQVIEFREGRVFRGDALDQLNSGEDLSQSLTSLLAGVMAELHAVDLSTCGLADLGRHQGFMQRNAGRWAGAAETISDGTNYASLAKEAADLVRSAFETWQDGDVTLLHCDLKLDNLILADSEIKPVALLDWDMATTGDPMFDLATLLSYWSEPGDPAAMLRLRQMPTARQGFPSRSDMVAAYERQTGRSLCGLDAARALCQLKLGVVFLQLYARWKESSVGDERYASFESLGIELIEFARDVALGKRA
ncbi:phosphotransferase family protein [Ruegeria sp. ANG-S4]|uniref:phosphotransferase family protein n=1 Tax=Ruegeria sp. ANG-S4 TaxID=1577904 RepID=UPI000691633F|nr:phosphotransferase family protein [Ruegeria sp. ANG-S4]